MNLLVTVLFAASFHASQRPHPPPQSRAEILLTSNKPARPVAASPYTLKTLRDLALVNDQLREEEAMAIRNKFEKNKTRDAFLLRQMGEKAAMKEEEKLDEMYEAEATKQWGQDDDAIFNQYAQMCLDEYVAAGKDPKPIELVMKKIKSRVDG